MDPVLIKLLKFKFRGALRRSFRGMKSVRGMVFFVLGMAALVMGFGPQIVILFIQPHKPDPEMLRDVLPLALFGLTMMSLLGGTRMEGICFTPAEVDMLFSGPFKRRDLLLYKIVAGLAGALFSSLFISLVLLRYASLWISAFTGALLAIVFIQFLSIFLMLLGQTMGQHFYTRTRKAVLVVFLGLAAVAVARWQPTFLEQGFTKAAHGLRESALGYWVFLPLEPLVRTIAAERIFPDMLGWALAATAMDLVLLAMIVRMDVNFLESSIGASQKRYALLQQRRQGRMVFKPKMSWRLPPFPWLWGAGPIAWRQLTTALRGLHGLLPFFFVIMMCSVVPMFIQTMKSSVATGLMGGMIGQVGLITMLMTRMVSFDFRGDLDGMDWLKSLPLRPTAIVLGQLITPILLLTGVQYLFLLTAMVFTPGSREILVVALLFAPLFNVLVLGVDNLLFLLFPSRIVSSTPGDFQHIGRTMLEMFVKMIVLFCVCGLSAALGWLGYWLTGNSWPVALSIAWTILLISGLTLIPLIAWAYEKFDVSLDTPA
jgi:hypothetical protein